MLQLVCFAKRTLNLEEFYVAFRNATGHNNYLPNVGNLENVKRRVMYLTGGLLETYWVAVPANDMHHLESRLHDSLQKISTVGEIDASQPFAIEVVSSIHRTVKEYLASTNWKDSDLKLLEQPKNAHELWLGICSKQFPPAFVADSKEEIIYKHIIQNNVISIGHLTPSVGKNVLKLQEGWHCDARDQRYLTKMSQEQSPLLAYAGGYLFEHAIGVEVDAGVSCLPYTLDLNHCFLDLHDLIGTIPKQPCVYCRPVSDMGFLSLRSDLIDVAHRLLAHYLIAYSHSDHDADGLDHRAGRRLLRYCGISSVEPSQDGSLTFVSAENMKETALRQHPPTTNSAQDTLCYIVRLLRTRETHSLHHSHSAILEIALRAVSEIEDTCLCIAMEGSNIALIKRLLDYRPPGLFRLRPKFGYLTNFLHVDLAQWLPPFAQNCLSMGDVEFGPLWFAHNAGRYTSYSHIFKYRMMLKLFLDRGEELQKPCSPIGTALHALVLKGHHAAIPKLLRLGLDVHAIGDFGNALELCWACAHTRKHRSYRFNDIDPLNINALIEHGVTINRVDPNGCAPGLQWIKYFVKRARNCEACRLRFSELYHGAGPYEKNPDIDRHLCGKLGGFEEI